MMPIAFNARFSIHRPTGMQRYAIELSRRFGEYLEPLTPVESLSGMAGHLWEQVYLPSVVKGRLLWSPNNTGPLAVEKQVCTIHDLIPLDHPEWFSQRFARWYGWLLPRLVRRVRHIIAVSEFTKTRVMERLKVPSSRITVILNGVDERFFPRSYDEIESTRRALSIPTQTYLLSVGSLEPRKNLARMLEAWGRVLSSIPEEITLVVAGARANKKVFGNCSIETAPTRVHFTGYVSDEHLPSLYSGAMALIYPSLYEGFGLPPLESMACGVPVVTSNESSLPEVVGEQAVLVDPKDVDSIAEGILRIVSQPSETQLWRERGRQRAARFSWDRSAQQTLQVLLAQA